MTFRGNMRERVREIILSLNHTIVYGMVIKTFCFCLLYHSMTYYLFLSFRLEGHRHDTITYVNPGPEFIKIFHAQLSMKF